MKNFLNTCLFFSASILTFSKGYCSDNLFKEEVNMLLNKALTSEKPLSLLLDSPLQEDLPLTLSNSCEGPKALIFLESLKIDKNSLASITPFIQRCSEHALTKPRLGSLYPEHQFYCTKEELEDYIKFSHISEEVAPLVRYRYHLLIGLLGLTNKSLSTALKSLEECARILPHRVRSDLNVTIYPFLQSHNNKTPLSPETFKDIAILYEKTRLASGLPFDVIDNIALTTFNYQAGQWEKVLSYGKKAASQSWPDYENPEYCFLKDKERLEFELGDSFYNLRRYEEALFHWLKGNYKDTENCGFKLGYSFYNLRKYEEALSCLLKGNYAGYNADASFLISACYAEKKDWENSWEYLREAYHKYTTDIFIPETAVLPIMETLKRTKKTERNYQHIFSIYIKALEKSFPYLRQGMQEIGRQINVERLEEVRNVIKKSIASNHYFKAKDLFNYADNVYKTIWSHSNIFSEINGEEYLGKVESIIEAIHSYYEEICYLVSQENLEAHVKTIVSKFDLLKKRTEELKEAGKHIEKEYKKHLLFLQKSESSASSLIPDYHSSTTTYNLKSEYIRKEGKQKKQPSSTSTTTVASPSAEVSSVFTAPDKKSIISFKTREQKTIWKRKDDTKFPPKAFELLEALNQSKSIYHLKKILTKGASIELLQGDRKGQISLRVNSKWRICFEWIPGKGAMNVEIVDYH